MRASGYSTMRPRPMLVGLLGRVVRQRLRAAVEDPALRRRPADDRGPDPQRAVLERHRAVRDARAVAVDVRAGAHSVSSGTSWCDEERRRAAPAHRSTSRPARVDLGDRRAQPGAAARERRVRHQPVEAEAGELATSSASSAAASGVCTPVRRSPVSHSTRKPTSVPARASAVREPAATTVRVAATATVPRRRAPRAAPPSPRRPAGS